MWLTHTRSTLDQYGVTAAAELEFTPMHKNLRVQFPDLRVLDFKVDFSIKTFNAIVQLCKEMGKLCKFLFDEYKNYFLRVSTELCFINFFDSECFIFEEKKRAILS